jgi:hypothetical protein
MRILQQLDVVAVLLQWENLIKISMFLRLQEKQLQGCNHPARMLVREAPPE